VVIDMAVTHLPVIPAKAGTHKLEVDSEAPDGAKWRVWVPAFAGMTNGKGAGDAR